MAKDPICGISLDTNSPFKSAHAGRIYVFCCRTCKAKFDKDPGRYAGPSGDAPLGRRPPSAPWAPPFLTHSSIGHFLLVVFHKAGSTKSRERSL